MVIVDNYSFIKMHGTISLLRDIVAVATGIVVIVVMSRVGMTACVTVWMAVIAELDFTYTGEIYENIARSVMVMVLKHCREDKCQCQHSA